MLKAIRKLNFGWMVLLLGVILMASGLSMTSEKSADKSLLCFDNGCLYIQGISNVALGILCLGFGVFLIIKK